MNPHSNILVFASANAHKILEMEALLGSSYSLLGLKDLDIYEEIPETGNTFQENAFQKSDYVYRRTQRNIFSDDSGLEVEALNGAPGIDSAHYSGSRDMQKNLDYLLLNMKGISNRKARFTCIISLIYNHQNHFFEGNIEGEILESPYGKGGFGYDPVFRPMGYSVSFAEMNESEKNLISHRHQAVLKMKSWLQSNSLVF